MKSFKAIVVTLVGTWTLTAGLARGGEAGPIGGAGPRGGVGLGHEALYGETAAMGRGVNGVTLAGLGIEFGRGDVGAAPEGNAIGIYGVGAGAGLCQTAGGRGNVNGGTLTLAQGFGGAKGPGTGMEPGTFGGLPGVFGEAGFFGFGG
jgi:hypothetical protein